MASLRGSSLRSFLSTARTALRQHTSQHIKQQASQTSPSAPLGSVLSTESKTNRKLTLVVGNESADLDSITSAIIYAYFQSCAPIPKALGVDSHAGPRIYIPVLNIPERDIRIRPELLKLLPHAGLDPSCLITLDEVFPDSSSSNDAIAKDNPPTDLYDLVLVDHNNPTGSFTKFKENVVGCVDHHQDEEVVPQPQKGSTDPRIISLEAGSCTSLVTEYVQPSWSALSTSASASGAANAQDDSMAGVEDEAMRRGWDAQIAKLALASILIDTNNLKSANKTRDVDRRMVSYLEARIYPAPPGSVGGIFDRQAFFQEIRNAKRDLDGLSTDEVLRKDYKQWSVGSVGNVGKGERTLGISSVVKPLEWLAQQAQRDGSDPKQSLTECINDFARARNLDVFAIMTTAKHGKPKQSRRELMVLVREDHVKGFIRNWENAAGEALSLKEHEGAFVQSEQLDDEILARIWWQEDVSKSRKQVAPLMREVLEKTT